VTPKQAASDEGGAHANYLGPRLVDETFELCRFAQTPSDRAPDFPTSGGLSSTRTLAPNVVGSRSAHRGRAIRKVTVVKSVVPDRPHTAGHAEGMKRLASAGEAARGRWRH
jgi:hypothetical protein